MSSLLEIAERHFGIADSVLADHLIELAVQSCTTIVANLDNAGDDEQLLITV